MRPAPQSESGLPLRDAVFGDLGMQVGKTVLEVVGNRCRPADTAKTGLSESENKKALPVRRGSFVR